MSKRLKPLDIHNQFTANRWFWNEFARYAYGLHPQYALASFLGIMDKYGLWPTPYLSQVRGERLRTDGRTVIATTLIQAMIKLLVDKGNIPAGSHGWSFENRTYAIDELAQHVNDMHSSLTRVGGMTDDDVSLRMVVRTLEELYNGMEKLKEESERSRHSP